LTGGEYVAGKKYLKLKTGEYMAVRGPESVEKV
jgi:hypothetical protein